MRAFIGVCSSPISREKPGNQTQPPDRRIEGQLPAQLSNRWMRPARIVIRNVPNHVPSCVSCAYDRRQTILHTTDSGKFRIEGPMVDLRTRPCSGILESLHLTLEKIEENFGSAENDPIIADLKRLLLLRIASIEAIGAQEEAER